MIFDALMRLRSAPPGTNDRPEDLAHEQITDEHIYEAAASINERHDANKSDTESSRRLGRLSGCSSCTRSSFSRVGCERAPTG